MKTNSISTGLAVPLLFLFALLEASAAQAAITSRVVAWGDNSYGQTSVPVQSPGDHRPVKPPIVTLYGS